ncbi:MAG: hydroxymethylbilane synthase [Methanobacteriota archaeon]|nr:MAG: hydroxymethylbilane synthase [Euryarchaeota archaeon]
MKVVIGTRGSRLALWQTDHIGRLLKEKHGLEYEKKRIKTTGDKITDVPLAKIGGKGLFVKELDDAVLDGRVDFAVHSMKDVPVDLPEGLVIAAVPEREETNDALISKYTLDELPKGAVVGTSSLRRIAQMKNHRPDIVVKDLRGNVDTRLRKLQEGQYDAIIMAKAGLKRLGFEGHIKETLPIEIFTPTVGQGAIAVVAREDSELIELLGSINHGATMKQVTAERSLLRGVGGGCQIPLGAESKLADGAVHLRGVMLSQDGKRKITAEARGSDPDRVGREVAEKLLSLGGQELLESISL